MSVELHGVDGFYNVSEAQFGRIIKDLLLNGVHIPVWAHTDFFSRTFWVDFESPKCVEKYFADFCHY
uniref:Uncharacterized protein n=1 Tax=Romanomermis culicivorax TaxID=13658 RepID=A0A915JEJ3_ROMCU